FVGYCRGRYLSTAAFLDDSVLAGATNYMFGLFEGAEIPIIPNLNFVGEVTGRDVNMGLEYMIAGFNISGGLTHAELFTAGDPSLKPRIDLGVSYSYNFGSAPQKKQTSGTLIINVVDNSSNKLLPATITFEDMDIKPIAVANGYVKMQIKPGKYKIKIESNNYKWQKREFSVTSNATSEINIKLNKKDDTEEINQNKAVSLAKEAKEKLNKGDIAGALLKLDEAQKLSPDDPTVLAYMQEANTKKAQMIKTYKENALMYEQKGWAKSAISEWNALLLLDKNNAEAKDHIKNLEKDANKTETKKETVKTETKKIDPEKVYEEGYMAYLAGDYKTAIKKFEEVLKADPNHEKAQKYLDKAKKRL
ncbi:MAG: tetratricopeptide repeat protein, partial [bacterium]|nr:tetratricopeptide repeat protein [bacterium]